MERERLADSFTLPQFQLGRAEPSRPSGPSRAEPTVQAGNQSILAAVVHLVCGA